MNCIRRALAIGPILALSLMLATGCNDDPVELQPDKTADFILKDLNGVEFQLSNSFGKVVVLNFFNVGCSTCQQQVPQMVELHGDLHAQGLEVVGISRASEADLKAFVDAFDIPYRVLRDDTENSRIFNYYQSFQGEPAPTPGIYVIDRKAKIRRVWFGEVVSVATLKETIQPLL